MRIAIVNVETGKETGWIEVEDNGQWTADPISHSIALAWEGRDQDIKGIVGWTNGYVKAVSA